MSHRCRSDKLSVFIVKIVFHSGGSGDRGCDSVFTTRGLLVNCAAFEEGASVMMLPVFKSRLLSSYASRACFFKTICRRDDTHTHDL